MTRITKPFTFLVERFYPDPFVFAIVLSAAIFLMCLGFTDAGPGETLIAWGDGLPELMEFIGQLALTLVASHALAHTDAVRRLLAKLGGLPKSPAVAYGMVALISGVANLISWALGLVIGALVAREVAIQARRRGLRLHYPLLVASAYAAFVLWSMGYSSSAALFVATPGHAMEKQMGGTLPVSETIFDPWNVAILLVGLLVVTLLMAALRPKEGRDPIVEIPDSLAHATDEGANPHADTGGTLDQPSSGGSRTDGGSATLARPSGTVAVADPRAQAGPVAAAPALTFGQRLDRSRLLSLVPATALAIYLGFYFADSGLNLTLDIVNWTFLCLGLFLARSVLHYVKLIGDASVTVGQIILQYPFYAGMMGMMAGTGLVEVIASWFVNISSAETLPFFSFLAAGFINMFIPSGGGQWAVQGPIFIEAAQALNVEQSRIVMGVSYGEWSNMIQPFWTIPMLAIAGLHVRQIMGYTFIVLVVFLGIFGGGLLLAGSGT